MAASFSVNLPFKLPVKFSILSFIEFSDSSLPLLQFDNKKLVKMMITKRQSVLFFHTLWYF